MPTRRVSHAVLGEGALEACGRSPRPCVRSTSCAPHAVAAGAAGGSFQAPRGAGRPSDRRRRARSRAGRRRGRHRRPVRSGLVVVGRIWARRRRRPPPGRRAPLVDAGGSARRVAADPEQRTEAVAQAPGQGLHPATGPGAGRGHDARVPEHEAEDEDRRARTPDRARGVESGRAAGRRRRRGRRPRRRVSAGAPHGLAPPRWSRPVTATVRRAAARPGARRAADRRNPPSSSGALRRSSDAGDDQGGGHEPPTRPTTAPVARSSAVAGGTGEAGVDPQAAQDAEGDEQDAGEVAGPRPPTARPTRLARGRRRGWTACGRRLLRPLRVATHPRDERSAPRGARRRVLEEWPQ